MNAARPPVAETRAGRGAVPRRCAGPGPAPAGRSPHFAAFGISCLTFAGQFRVPALALRHGLSRALPVPAVAPAHTASPPERVSRAAFAAPIPANALSNQPASVSSDERFAGKLSADDADCRSPDVFRVALPGCAGEPAGFADGPGWATTSLASRMPAVVPVRSAGRRRARRLGSAGARTTRETTA